MTWYLPVIQIHHFVSQTFTPYSWHKSLIRILPPDQRLVENKKDRGAGLQWVLHPGTIHIAITLNIQRKQNTNCRLIYLEKNKIQYLRYLQYLQYLPKGDLEKAMGNKPMESMDRERACIPTLQVNYLYYWSSPSSFHIIFLTKAKTLRSKSGRKIFFFWKQGKNIETCEKLLKNWMTFC